MAESFNLEKDLDEVSSPLPESKLWTYQCKICGGRFRSYQALGGHQNAHRYQREKARQFYELKGHDHPFVSQNLRMCSPTSNGPFVANPLDFQKYSLNNKGVTTRDLLTKIDESRATKNYSTYGLIDGLEQLHDLDLSLKL